MHPLVLYFNVFFETFNCFRGLHDLQVRVNFYWVLADKRQDFVKEIVFEVAMTGDVKILHEYLPRLHVFQFMFVMREEVRLTKTEILNQVI
jgi:hypothetical protein